MSVNVTALRCNKKIIPKQKETMPKQCIINNVQSFICFVYLINIINWIFTQIVTKIVSIVVVFRFINNCNSMMQSGANIYNSKNNKFEINCCCNYLHCSNCLVFVILLSYFCWVLYNILHIPNYLIDTNTIRYHTTLNIKYLSKFHFVCR